MTKRLIHSWDNQKVNSDDDDEDEEEEDDDDNDDDIDDDNSLPQDWHLPFSLKMLLFFTLFGVFMRQNINLEKEKILETNY